MTPFHEDEDAAVDALLQTQFEGAVPDDGFCDRVMQRLRTRPRGRAWPLWTGIASGVVACSASLSSMPMVHLGWKDWLGGELSAPAIVLLLAFAGMSLLAMCWSLAEAEGS